MSVWTDLHKRSTGEADRKEDIPQIEVDAYFEIERKIWRVSFLCDDESYMEDNGAFFMINWYSESGFNEIEDEVMEFINEVKKDMTISGRKDIDTLMNEVRLRSEERLIRLRGDR